ncbi:MAG: GntR family transcriptional regulator [Acetobacteraceae bacterium]
MTRAPVTGMAAPAAAGDGSATKRRAAPKALGKRNGTHRRIGTFDRSPIPLYIQVATLLRNRIAEGKFRPGQKIPALDALEQEFAVARVTVRQAVELLEKEGIVQRQQGRGTFVSPHLAERRWLHLMADMASLATAIDAHIPRFLLTRSQMPELRPGEGEPASGYQFLLSVQYRGGEPFAVASVHVERSIYERSPRDFCTRAALPVLLRLEREAIEHAQLTVVVGSADFETSERLRMPLNSPTAEAHFFVRNRQGIVTYVSDVVYRGDCVRFDIDLLRSAGEAQPARADLPAISLSRASNPRRQEG